MDNIRRVIKILFRSVSSSEILSNNIDFNNITKENFLRWTNAYINQYSNNELANLYSFLVTQFEWHNNKMRNQLITNVSRGVNVFDALVLFGDAVLTEENGMPVCTYENLLRWRNITIELGEDIFITSYLAYRDILNNKLRKNFFWPPVIGHNNKSLNRLLDKGVAENHFHLKGSAPLFHLSWISMMNNPSAPIFRRVLKKYDSNRLHMNINYNVNYTEQSLYMQFLQATLIRLCLFAYIKECPFYIYDNYINYADIKNCLKEEYIEENKSLYKGNDKVCISNLKNEFRSKKEYYNIQCYIMRRDVKRLLDNNDELENHLLEINNIVESMQTNYAPKELDYTLCENYLVYNRNSHLNEVINGERWLLYTIFTKIYSGDQGFECYIKWFYAYLVIKENVRAEMIQVNGNVGFDNFLKYQDRKEEFIITPQYENAYLRMAVRDTILNQNIKRLEARITPKNTAEKIMQSIKKYDKIISVYEPDIIYKYFYVVHFIKTEDDEFNEDYLKAHSEYEFNELKNQYRHYSKRNEMKRQAYALMKFRKKYGTLADRIKGIDASSSEIVCRPEVFAQAFRYLRGVAIEYMDCSTGENIRVSDLSITYHVGEDFLDVIDGLRAIDEAVVFLNMRCGDRLGHALALGVDVKEWYNSKSNYILISQMDYLDNIVWLYSKIREYSINGYEDILQYIERKYDEYFKAIYKNYMCEDDEHMIIKKAREYYKQKNIGNIYETGNMFFSINTYYNSWKLRGDNPENYKDGYFSVGNNFNNTEWDEYAINKKFPKNYMMRYNSEEAYLYYLYHYNKDIKTEGNKKKEIKVNPRLIEAVAEVQKNMQYEIARRGIGIETNPSSNALIGTFKRYDKHPILGWYNNGLAVKHEDVLRVPQLQVSINTDDQGVFATYIKNEYAYLALAIEKLKDADNKPLYSRTLIYEWLDNVRRMGLAQSFDENMEENN